MKLRCKVILCLIVLHILIPFSSEACKPTINWGSTISFCQGNSITLNAANANATYLWSTGAGTPSISVNTSGTYWVSVTNQCGTTSDTIQVIVDSPINVNLGPDRAICAQSSTVLSVPQSVSATYSWSTGAWTNQITVSNPGTYWVSVTNACDTYTDTIEISLDLPQAVNLGPDVMSCSSNSAVLKLQSPVDGVVNWSNNATGDSIVVTSSGTYWASVTNACGTFTDTVEVNFFNQNDLFTNDTVLFCFGNTYTLNSPFAVGSHLWSDASTATSLVVAQPGTYWLQVVLPCGVFSDTVHFVPNTAPVVNLGADTTMCPGQSLVLDAQNPGASYRWSNTSTNQTLTVTTGGYYWVGVNTGCGYVYDTIRVRMITTPNPNIDDTVYVCNGGMASVNAKSWGAQSYYLWSNQVTTRVNDSLLPGSHWVKVYNGCDTVTEHFYVKSQPHLNIDLGPDTAFCGTSLWLFSNVGHHGNDILWSNGSTVPQIRVTRTGTYWVKVTNACGVFTDTINVTINKYPSGIAATTIKKCVSSGVWIRTQSISGATYQWSNGSNASSTYATTPGKYWVTVSNVCDTIHDTVMVKDVYPVNFDLGNDTSFCRPATLGLDLSSLTADSVVWSTGSRSRNITIANSGTYWAKVYNLCGYTSDTITVTVNEHVVPVLSNVTICAGGNTTLSAAQPNATSYLWSTNDTTPSITASAEGWYSVYITGICGTIKDSAYVTNDAPLPAINLGNDTIFCAGSLKLNAGSYPRTTYQWSNNSTKSSITVSQTGTYYVTASNTCNTVSDTIHVLVTGPPVAALGNTVKFCAGSSFTINAQNPGSTYNWSTGDSTQSVTFSTAGVYWVNITNDCGSFVDSVELVIEQPMPDVSIGADTSFCMGDTLWLKHNKGDVNTRWYNGSPMDSIAVTAAGTYWVEVFNSCGSWYDTINVGVIDYPFIDLGSDITICSEGGQATLSATPGMKSYLWSNGATTMNTRINQVGTYWVTVSNECFSSTDTIEVYPEYPIQFDLGPDTTLCAGEVYIIDPFQSKGKGPANNHAGAPYQEVTESGMYYVSVENLCGVFSDTIEIKFNNYLDMPDWDTTICDDESVTVDLSSFPHPFEWFDGKTDKVRTFSKEGTYPIVINNQCGEFMKNYRVNVSNCDCPFFVPNAFTPDFDGVNDEFTIVHSCDLVSFEIQIFNRWGALVFESNNIEQSWNGSFNGEAAPQGVYTYRLSYKWDVYGEEHSESKTGTLTLIR